MVVVCNEHFLAFLLEEGCRKKSKCTCSCHFPQYKIHLQGNIPLKTDEISSNPNASFLKTTHLWPPLMSMEVSLNGQNWLGCNRIWCADEGVPLTSILDLLGVWQGCPGLSWGPLPPPLRFSEWACLSSDTSKLTHRLQAELLRSIKITRRVRERERLSSWGSQWRCCGLHLHLWVVQKHNLLKTKGNRSHVSVTGHFTSVASLKARWECDTSCKQ